MASDIFAKIGDIKGESLDDKHKDEIEVLSWSWGVSNPARAGGGSGGGAGKATFHDLSFTHHIDKASPLLLKGCATGQHLKEATITHRKAGKGQQEFLIIKMNDVIITSVSTRRSHDSHVESVSLAFAKVDLEYKPQKATGHSMPASTSSTTSRATRRASSSEPLPGEDRALSLDEAVSVAIVLQQTGQWAAADEIYRTVLEAAPDHADALHFSGVLAHQQARSEQAVALIERSLELEPERADWHSNLGIVRQDRRRARRRGRRLPACDRARAAPRQRAQQPRRRPAGERRRGRSGSGVSRRPYASIPSTRTRTTTSASC